MLAASIDYDAIFARLAELAVQGLADLCLVDLMGEDGSIQRVAAAHADPKRRSAAKLLQSEYAPTPSGSHPVARVIRTGRPECVSEMPEDFLWEITRDEGHFRLVREMGFQSLICVPLTARGRVLGTLTLVSTTPGRRFEEKDLSLAEELARRAAVRIDNARLYYERDHIARTLQQSLLPPALPGIPGFEIGALYQPAGEGHEVGGDFYDVFETASGGWAIVVGDVCGKGPEAAAVTGLARHSIRAIAMHQGRPSKVLRALNEALLGDRSDRFCTVCYLTLRPLDNGARLEVSLGGHPPPVVLRSTGAVERLGVPGRILGVFEELEVYDARSFVGPGDALILYTDGLIGRREEEAFSEQGVFKRTLPSLVNKSAPQIVQQIKGALSSLSSEEPSDDVAVVVLKCRA